MISGLDTPEVLFSVAHVRMIVIDTNSRNVLSLNVYSSNNFLENSIHYIIISFSGLWVIRDMMIQEVRSCSIEISKTD
jgi:hypothetical protein